MKSHYAIPFALLIALASSASAFPLAPPTITPEALAENGCGIECDLPPCDPTLPPDNYLCRLVEFIVWAVLDPDEGLSQGRSSSEETCGVGDVQVQLGGTEGNRYGCETCAGSVVIQVESELGNSVDCGSCRGMIVVQIAAEGRNDVDCGATCVGNVIFGISGGNGPINQCAADAGTGLVLSGDARADADALLCMAFGARMDAVPWAEPLAALPCGPGAGT